MSQLRLLLSLIVAVGLLIPGCGGESSSSGSRRQANSPGVEGGGSSGAGSMSPGDDRFGNSSAETPDLPQMPRDGAPVDPNACQSTGRSAEQGLSAVDIVWVIDGSGSMIDEAQRVQDNIDSFVSSISSAGVDTRVVLIAQGDLVPANSALATAGNYRFVQHDVDSHNALESIVARYPDFSSFLRPMAHVHFIIVTDDESQYQGLPSASERAQAFRDALAGQLQNDYSVHAIVSPGMWGAPPCQPMADAQLEQCCTEYINGGSMTVPTSCDAYMADLPLCPFFVPPLSLFFLGGAFANGETYSTLASDTAGVQQSICQTDWTDVFSSLSDAVIESAPLPCNYEIPEPPPGMVFDTSKVNVKYAPPGMDSASVAPWGNVADMGACGDANAWYFDDPSAPAEVLLCPAACEVVGSGAGGTLDVLFGCATIPLE